MKLMFFWLIPLLWGAVSPLQAAERLALLIGNRDHAHITDLRSTHNDVDELAKRLQRLGFEVTLVKDAGRDALRQSVVDFGHRAGRAEMAVVFYAGYGFKVQGKNYLIPVDAENPNQWYSPSLQLLDPQSLMVAAGRAPLSLVLLDTCWDFSGDNVSPRAGESLEAMDIFLPNQLVWLAAEPGTPALDGEREGNSPFTQALLEQLDHNAGRDIRQLFPDVVSAVQSATDGKQRPFRYGTLQNVSEVCLGSCQSEPSVDREVEWLVAALEAKFGALTANGIERIRQATPEQRLTWLVRGMTAASLTEVFEG